MLCILKATMLNCTALISITYVFSVATEVHIVKCPNLQRGLCGCQEKATFYTLELPWSTQAFIAVRYKVHTHGLHMGSALVVHDHAISEVGVTNLVT